MDPDLRAAVDKVLKPYKGETLEIAEMAVMEVYHSGAEGSFDEIVATYEEAVAAAVS
jgi:hypothetical protein